MSEGDNVFIGDQESNTVNADDRNGDDVNVGGGDGVNVCT